MAMNAEELREARRLSAKRFRAKNTGWVKAYNKRRNADPKVKARLLQLQRKYSTRRKANGTHFFSGIKKLYGVTPEQYVVLCASQNNRCLICDLPGEMSRHGRLSIDHNHATGKVRGLLCELCNGALGLFRDDIVRLEIAVLYLKERDK